MFDKNQIKTLMIFTYLVCFGDFLVHQISMGKKSKVYIAVSKLQDLEIQLPSFFL